MRQMDFRKKMTKLTPRLLKIFPKHYIIMAKTGIE